MKVLILNDKYFAADMAWGFRQLGHDVHFVSTQTQEPLDEIFSKKNPELVLSLGSPSEYSAGMLESLGNRKASSFKCVHWDTDGETWMGVEMRHIDLLKPDFVFTICPEMLKLLHQKNINSEILFYAYNPETHYPGPVLPEFKNQINFIGGAYPYSIGLTPKHLREVSMDVLFKPLLETGCRVDFYGDPYIKLIVKSLYQMNLPDQWQHGECSYSNTSSIYRSCRINLVTQNHQDTLTKRVFEILGSDGFALSYDNAAVRKYFTPGKDIVVSSTPEQTLELVEYYKAHDDEYFKIRQNALQSIQNHTYKQRAEQIINTLSKL